MGRWAESRESSGQPDRATEERYASHRSGCGSSIYDVLACLLASG